jgi:hypothetical protein
MTRAIALLGMLIVGMSGCQSGRCQTNTDCNGGTVCVQDPPGPRCPNSGGWPCVSGQPCDDICPSHCAPACDAGCADPAQSCAPRRAILSIGDNYDAVSTAPVSACVPDGGAGT